MNGETPAECAKNLNDGVKYEKGPIKIDIQGAKCETKTIENSCTQEGKKIYHPEKVAECADALEKQSCEERAKKDSSPPSCQEICQAS